MKTIGVLSDTHGFIHPRVSDFFKDCDIIIHAGDIGSVEAAEQLMSLKPLKAVYGNIDGGKLRLMFKEYEFFKIEEINILLKHITGTPKKYNPETVKLINSLKPDILITGHSHILKVLYDDKNNLLYINPGAAGKYGFHKEITMVKFTINGKEIKDMEVFSTKR